MTPPLRTEFGNALLRELRPVATKALIALNSGQFAEAKEAVAKLHAQLPLGETQSFEAELNDLYVLKTYSDFLRSYIQTWEEILEQRFSKSWDSLQDTLDRLRQIKKFSAINFQFFETQLVELEKTYPYGVFFSIAATVDHFECSLCGLDIDSDECSHMRGELYAGVVAHGIARSVREIDHISMVSNPRDKRCVVRYDDAGEQFNVVRYLSELLAAKQFRIADFGMLRFSKRRQPNPEFRKLGRNEPCYCGSGRKFKQCCISKAYVEGDHVDIVAEQRNIEDAVA
jgi:hypothetical protein